MEIVGVIFLVLLGILILTGLAVTVRSLPDIGRYRRLRRM